MPYFLQPIPNSRFRIPDSRKAEAINLRRFCINRSVYLLRCFFRKSLLAKMDI